MTDREYCEVVDKCTGTLLANGFDRQEVLHKAYKNASVEELDREWEFLCYNRNPVSTFMEMEQFSISPKVRALIANAAPKDQPLVLEKDTPIPSASDLGSLVDLFFGEND